MGASNKGGRVVIAGRHYLFIVLENKNICQLMVVHVGVVMGLESLCRQLVSITIMLTTFHWPGYYNTLEWTNKFQ